MKVRAIALYLPQYHPIPENDKWWGKGFTEWTNVAKSKPLFKGHYQPKIPTELGFYDLRLSEVREAQAQLAKEAGVEGFCYWHYWFGNGRQLLERPFNEVLESGKPDFPFCLGWANHSWTSKTWNKEKHNVLPGVLMEQEYLGTEDYEKHFYSVLPAFKDKRYITVDGKPFFLIFDPIGFEDVSNFISVWQELAKQNGLKGIHFVAYASAMYKNPYTKQYQVNLVSEKEVCDYIIKLGFDAINLNGQTRANTLVQGKYISFIKLIAKKVFGIKTANKVKQKDINQHLFCDEDKLEYVYPTLIPNYDRTPRTDKDIVYYDSTPEVFGDSIKDCISYLDNKADEHKIVIIKSWNEWGEGNYLEPDIKYGRGYLDIMSKIIKE